MTPHPNHTRKPPANAPTHAIPPHHALRPCTPVVLILKRDQPSGHRVAGLVAERLTRGDHPRGVKVRLRDGRVGRVQAIVSEGEGLAGERMVGGPGAGLGRDGGTGSAGAGAGAGVGAGASAGVMRGGRAERDIRDHDEYLFDEERCRSAGVGGLFAALEDADRGVVRSGKRGKRGGAGAGAVEDSIRTGVEVVDTGVQGNGAVIPTAATATANCPVCGAFEGDEAAVAYHVEEHFGS